MKLLQDSSSFMEVVSRESGRGRAGQGRAHRAGGWLDPGGGQGRGERLPEGDGALLETSGSPGAPTQPSGSPLSLDFRSMPFRSNSCLSL